MNTSNPSPTAVSVIRTANPNSDRYFQEMRGAFAGVRVFDPDHALSRDPWIYEKMLRDPLVRQCLAERLRAIAGGEWSIVPPKNATEADEQAAAVVESCISELDGRGFLKARLALAKFVWEGVRHSVIYGKRKPRTFGEDKRSREWWVPTRLRDMSKRRVRMWREGGNVRRRIERIMGDEGVSYDRYDFDEDRIITAVYDDEEGRLGFGRGLAETVYWHFFFRWKLMNEGIDSARAWAQGITVGKLANSPLGATDQTTEETRDAFVAALAAMKAKGVIVVDKEDDIESFDALGDGADRMLQWWKSAGDEMRTFLTGAKLPSGGGSETGSLARAQVEQDTSEGLYQLDSALFDEAMTEYLVRAVWERNRENLAELGLADARMPSFRSSPEKKQDVEVNAQIVTSMLNAGARLRMDEAMGLVGLTPVTEEDEAAGNVLETVPRPAPGADPVLPPEEGDPSPFAHEAAARTSAADWVHLHRFASEAPDDAEWLDALLREAGATMREHIRAILERRKGSPEGMAAHDASMEEIRGLLEDALTAGHLEGRAEISDRVEALTGEAPPVAEFEPAVPRVPFGEAVSDIVKRRPELHRTAEAVAEAYRRGPVFAMARSVDAALTERVQGILADFMRKGADFAPTVEQVVREAGDFTNSYAETVIRTNVTTANTEGRFAQAKDPVTRSVVPAFMFSAVRDSDVRRGRKDDHGENHLAADGLIAAVDDPIWQQVAPPCGYNCRCRVVLMTKYDLGRRGLLDDQGRAKRHVPAGFSAFRRHPNFTRTRMPGT